MKVESFELSNTSELNILYAAVPILQREYIMMVKKKDFRSILECFSFLICIFEYFVCGPNPILWMMQEV